MQNKQGRSPGKEIAMQAFGKTRWLIPDCYRPVVEPRQLEQPYQSHDAICVLNTGDEDAVIDITLYFEDREPLTGWQARCGARRTHHIRLDKLKSQDGRPVPDGVPYAALVTSTEPVVVQYSRLDATQDNNTLMTTLGWPL
jgi:hypothetical protein